MIPCKTLLIRFTNYDMMGLFIKNHVIINTTVFTHCLRRN